MHVTSNFKQHHRDKAPGEKILLASIALKLIGSLIIPPSPRCFFFLQSTVQHVFQDVQVCLHTKIHSSHKGITVRVVIDPGPEKEVGSGYFWNAHKEARGWMKWTKQSQPPHTELVTISATHPTVSRAKSEYQNRTEGKGLQSVINKKKACYTPSLRDTSTIQISYLCCGRQKYVGRHLSLLMKQAA